ncbi:MAG: hypothetical protein WC156_07920 [Pedobacter sp.]
MNLHVFIPMPYGAKEGIDFNKVYEEYTKPTGVKPTHFTLSRVFDTIVMCPGSGC